jgi:hypothetical protein
VTSPVLTPWWRDRTSPKRVEDASGSTDPTRILDWKAASVLALVRQARERSAPGDQTALLRAAHSSIVAAVRPVYSVNDAMPVSRVLARGRGSCSQRFAVLEAVARASGIATRVRGRMVDGRFWYPRFPHLRWLVPSQVVLAWPQFRLAGVWLDANELFGSMGELVTNEGFSNAGGETLFEAVCRTAVDWDGRTADAGGDGSCDLSSRVLSDLGLFDSRDALFSAYGQTLSWPARLFAEPILGRRDA